MSAALWYGLVGSGGLAMLALPFVPLWREWVHPTDSSVNVAMAVSAGLSSSIQ